MPNLEMRYLGDPNVLEDLLGGNEETTLLLPGGGQGCIYQAGVLKYLEEQQLKQNIASIYANSGGTIMGWNLLGNSVAKNIGCMYEENITEKFVDLRRGRGLVDLAGLSERMLTTRGIDFAAFQNSQAELFAGTTTFNTGTHTFHQVPKTTLEEAIPYVFASFAIPGISKLRVWVDGERETDGSFSDPLPAQFVDSQRKNLLVILAQPFAKKAEVPIWMVNCFNGYPRSLLNHTREYNHGIDYLTQKLATPNSKTAIICPIQVIPPDCMDRSLLMAGESAAYNFIRELATNS